ncbi:hypothetical protein A3D88_04535 [Candidatus Peribacteria bacterium RIFCSPHIGHO2_02_FULL_52_16]|nr:MAG: hypothetical protein A2706_03165 [Candidatus Peribacteria bacterium RIFCSPHIGHO2_01_FULL_51_35]OGJ60872.1 MAG: hypothetical protein A3D88_04535 [Candidatus Peribacteria bacterium RIFCSPHIGHO2_02_FULL_52_16]
MPVNKHSDPGKQESHHDRERKDHGDESFHPYVGADAPRRNVEDLLLRRNHPTFHSDHSEEELIELEDAEPLIELEAVPESEHPAESRDILTREKEVVCIPDIHGDVYAFEKSLQEAGYADADGILTAEGKKNHILLIGDLIDRGTTNLAVLAKIQNLEEQGATITVLAGNHDLLMLDTLQTGNPDALGTWFGVFKDNGGMSVIREILRHREQLKTDLQRKGIPVDAQCTWMPPVGQQTIDFMSEKYHFAREDLREALGIAKALFTGNGPHASVFRNMKIMERVDDVLYVHAGVDETWANIFAHEGAEGANRTFSAMMQTKQLGKLMEGKELGGIVWMRPTGRLNTVFLTLETARILRSRGIRAVVHGHTHLKDGQAQTVLYEDDPEREIIVINGDVGMSARYNGGHGYVRVDRKGEVTADGRTGKKMFGTLPTRKDQNPTNL